MTTTNKKVNYTEAQEKTLREIYHDQGSDDLKALAALVGKSEKSVLQKLVKMGIYRKKQPTTKTGQPIVKKDDLSSALADFIGLSEPDAASLEKANKTALIQIIQGYEKMSAKLAELMDISSDELQEIYKANQGAILDTVLSLEIVEPDESAEDTPQTEALPTEQPTS